MVYAILSDIHANATALERALAEAQRLGADVCVWLGDVVGYGPQPAECLERIRRANATILAGNHDDAVSGRLDPKDFIDLAADAVSRHRDALSADARNFLKSLPYTLRKDGFAATHGDFTDPPAFNYVASSDDAAASFVATAEPLLFVGHTHRPALFVVGSSGQVHELSPVDFTLEDGKRYLVNPGSVGYPRENDGTCLSSFVLYDSGQRTVTFHYLPFAVSSLMQRGTAPRRRIGPFAALAVLAAALGVLAVGLLRNGADSAQPVSEDIVTNVTLSVRAGEKVRANLKLAKGSPHAVLRTDFLAADGTILKRDVGPVRDRSSRSFRACAGSTSARLSVLPEKPDRNPVVGSFNPTVEPAKR